MTAVIQSIVRSDRLLLAVSFACFAVAGVATGTAEALSPGQTVTATALAVIAVYCLAQYANRVSRRTLAHLSVAFWVGFLGISGLHLIGLEAVGSAMPGSSAVLVASLTAITWATFLTACGATTFLGFREYGASSGHAAEEQVLEGDTSDYSTR
ncbi:hypothetical protein [Natronolimnobius baerhuensis]|uniref:Uncharacterized protein n=1 Tax=Natronolimnobius baerhuensis TaxID=253108 RepID=A0A202EBU7_9EURY|nr:hypothetical protein [Natronolimnobius baerhuensis]OVE85702.1 hypothetical protein B2G88_02475 [Natronolimnobius baerhuensis]